MKKRYILDMTKAEIPEWWPVSTPNEIHLIEVDSDTELDVDAALMPKGWRVDFCHCYEDRFPHLKNDEAGFKPAGFKFSSLPKGATLTRIS